MICHYLQGAAGSQEKPRQPPAALQAPPPPAGAPAVPPPQQQQQPAVRMPATDTALQAGGISAALQAALQAALNSQGNNNHAVLMLAVKELLPLEERGPARVALAGAQSLTQLTELILHISHTVCVRIFLTHCCHTSHTLRRQVPSLSRIS
jgi:hypothetical protein